MIAGWANPSFPSPQRKELQDDVDYGSTKSKDKHPACSDQTPDDDLAISKVRAALQESELKRVRFCNEKEDDNYIYYEFVVEKASTDEQKKIAGLVKSAKGKTTDWFSENVISWQRKLLDEYDLPNEYDYFSISVNWPKNSKDGQYSIIGIKKENLAYDKDNNPYSKDGKVNIVRLGTIFDAQRPWRFSHLLDSSHP